MPSGPLPGAGGMSGPPRPPPAPGFPQGAATPRGMQNWPAGPFQPPQSGFLGGQASPGAPLNPHGGSGMQQVVRGPLAGVAPEGMAMMQGNQSTGGLEQEENQIMRQLLNLQSDLSSKNPQAQTGPGGMMQTGVQPNGPGFGNPKLTPMTPNNIGNNMGNNMYGQQNNQFGGQQGQFGGQGQMQQNMQQRPQGMMQNHMRPQGGMQHQNQQNFRPQGMMQQNNPNMMQQQNAQSPNFNQQMGGGMRPQNNMQQQFRPPNQFQQNTMGQNASGLNPMGQNPMQQNFTHGIMGAPSAPPAPGQVPNSQTPLHAGLLALQQQQGSPQQPGMPAMQPGVARGPMPPHPGHKAMTHAAAKAAPPPPPPSPPPEHDSGLSRTNSGPMKERSKNQGPAFGKRFMELRKEYPGVEVPTDMWTYSLEDLETYFASKGEKKAGVAAANAPPATAGGTPDVAAAGKAESDRKSPKSSRKRKATGPPPEEELQYSPEEALEIQGELIEGFGHRMFQDELKRIQSQFPERKKKGHKDMPAYFDAFQNLTLGVFSTVLPRHKLEGDWDGVRLMIARMTDALKHPKVKKTNEEINVLMGLPRNAIFQPPRKEEEMFIFHPRADAPVSSYSRPTVLDEDGDEGHEFFVEDQETGELRIQGPTALEDVDCFYVVRHAPSVVLRSKPDLKADMVGRKKTAKRVRVQRVVDGRWAQLHAAELVRLGVKEAWVPLDGALLDCPGQQLLERET